MTNSQNGHASASASTSALPARGPGSAHDHPDDSSILALDSFPETGTPKHDKLSSWDLYKSLGSPKRIVAPMVDQSELAWRILSRRYGADLVYTPMINAGMFVTAINAHIKHKGKGKGRRYLDENFDLDSGEEGAELIELLDDERADGQNRSDTDMPLVVQFCANKPEILLQAAQYVEHRCSAVDLNLGCPQGIARKGHYGAFLQEDWPLIFSLVNTLHLNCKAPVTAKMRIFPSLARTVAYARMLERAGAQILTVHGRTREMKGHYTGLADWEAIRAVKNAVKIPVFANGNVQYPADVDLALRRTGADGIMSAEGNLYNPTIFLQPSSPLLQAPSTTFPLAPEFPFPAVIPLAHEYLDIVRGLRTQTGSSAIKAHLFKICRPALEVHPELREMLGRSHLQNVEDADLATGDANAGELERREKRLVDYRTFVRKLAEKVEVDLPAKFETFRQNSEQSGPMARKPIPKASASPYTTTTATVDSLVVDCGTPATLIEESDQQGDSQLRPLRIPHWLCQPYFRPELPPEHFQKNNEEAALRAAEKAALKKAKSGDAKREREDGGDEQEPPSQGTTSKSVVDGSSGQENELTGSKRIRALIEEGIHLKEEGNRRFLAKQIPEALAFYEDALAVLPPQPHAPEQEEDQVDGADGAEEVEEIASAGVKASQDEDEAECARLRAALYANVAACNLALDQYDHAISACSSALVDDPKYVKAFYHRATAYEKKGGWVSLSNAEQ
ncbi:tRNA dihydrouridine synthase, partial [Tilletia horrida]